MQHRNTVSASQAENPRVVELLADAFKLALIWIATIAILALPERAEAAGFCDEFRDMAVEIMEAHQDGAPLLDLMEHARGVAVVEAVVLDAARRPIFADPEERARYVSMWGDLHLLKCHQGL